MDDAEVRDKNRQYEKNQRVGQDEFTRTLILRLDRAERSRTMAVFENRPESRKGRKFMPCMGGSGLEERALMTSVQVLQKPSVNSQYPAPSSSNPNSKNFVRLGNGLTMVHIRGRKIVANSASGGMGTLIQDIDGELWVAYLQDPLDRRSPAGTIRAFPDSGGRVKFIVDGTTENTELVIEPYAKIRPRNQAHAFSAHLGRQDKALGVSDIQITSGKINSILGYRTVNLSGKVTIAGDNPVSRIAVNSIQPGASIITGGDLNTLNVYNSAVFDGGTGISVGRDLNWMTVYGNLEFRNGADLIVGRDIGLNTQPDKGTSSGGQGALINGNMYIAPGSSMQVGRALDSGFVIQGRLDGANHISIPTGGGNLIALGGYYPTP